MMMVELGDSEKSMILPSSMVTHMSGNFITFQEGPYILLLWN